MARTNTEQGGGGGGGTVTQINTAGSVAGGPITTSGTINLVNDVTSPGNNKVYGTDGTGVRGWQDAAILPTLTQYHIYNGDGINEPQDAGNSLQYNDSIGLLTNGENGGLLGRYQQNIGSNGYDFNVYSFPLDANVFRINGDDNLTLMNESDVGNWKTIIGGTSGTYPLTIRSQGNLGYGYAQFGIQNAQTEVQMSLDNLSVDGRSYGIMSTGTGSGVGVGKLILADRTANNYFLEHDGVNLTDTLGDVINDYAGIKLNIDQTNQTILLGNNSSGYNWNGSNNIASIHIPSGGMSGDLLVDMFNLVSRFTVGGSRNNGYWIDTTSDPVLVYLGNESVKLVNAKIGSSVLETVIGEETNPTTNRTHIKVDDTNNIINAYGTYNATPNSPFLQLDFANGVAVMGDAFASANGTQAYVDDSQQIASIGNNNAQLQTDGANINFRGLLAGNFGLYIDTVGVTGNTSAGFAALNNGAITGSFNSAFGATAGANYIGDNGVFFGYNAGNSLVGADDTDSQNTYIGAHAGENDTDSTGSVYLGSGVGASVISGNNYLTLLGAFSDVENDNTSRGGIAIGYGSKAPRGAASIGGDLNGSGAIDKLFIGVGRLNENPGALLSDFGVTVAVSDYASTGNEPDDAPGMALRFHYGNSTGTGGQGVYTYEGGAFVDSSGNMPNDVGSVIENHQGYTYSTTDGSFNIIKLFDINSIPLRTVAGSYNIEIIASCAESGGTNWATLRITQGFFTDGSTLSTSDPDVLEMHGTSTFTNGTTGVALELQDDGTGAPAVKIRGVASTNINWKINWRYTFAAI